MDGDDDDYGPLDEFFLLFYRLLLRQKRWLAQENEMVTAPLQHSTIRRRRSKRTAEVVGKLNEYNLN